MALSRRELLKHAGCAACAVGAQGLLLPQTDARAADTFTRLDRAGKLRLADQALDLAKRAGALYADVRIGRMEDEYLGTREKRLEELNTRLSVGIGIRVLLDGSWGFAASALVDEAEVKTVLGRAVENAKAARLLQANPIVLEELGSYVDDWHMPMLVDPFGVSIDEKAAQLLAVNDAALKAGASYCSASLYILREEKFFASSRGSRIEQSRVRIMPSFEVTATDKASGRFATRKSLAAPRAAGFEYVASCDLPGEAEHAAEEAKQKLTAKPVIPGSYDLVIDATNLYLTVHESIGHGTELDRALGYEANYAGTSFITPEKLGTFRYGSPLLTILADRSQEGGLATVRYDDDGVPSMEAAFPIIENGIFKNYQMAMGQAQAVGRARSNGCAYAQNPQSFPLQRMPNVSMKPNSKTMSRNDLIAGVDKGILIIGDGSWSIDQQRYNFQFGGQLFYEIKNGKRGAMLRDVAYQARAPEFWGALDGLGDRSTYHLGGTFFCGKGQPEQIAPVSHGAVAARFRKINVLNTERKDI